MSAAVLAVLACAGFLVGAGPATATPGDIGHPGPSFVGAANAPTSDKPQSKLWYADGIWWADMFDTVSGTWHIFRLDRSSNTWIDTGVPLDNRANTLADTLWNGSYLYVASHVVTVSSDSGAKPSMPGSPARLYRYSYSSADERFTLDPGFPTVISDNSSESLTIDQDSTGTLWATWTQVSQNPAGDYTSAVYVNSSDGGGGSWGTPFVLPTAGANPAPDDISTLVAFGGNKVGVLWSNQVDDTVYWAVHVEGTDRTSWRGSPAIRGNRQADDHLNIKSIASDQAGRVFAAVKTSADVLSTSTPATPQILVLVFKPGTGSWSTTTFGTLADCHTRPQLVLDPGRSRVHVVATAPTDSGCAYSGAPGTIYAKSAPLDDPVFPSGRGTPIIRDAASANMNNATTTKQSITDASGLVVLAGNTSTRRYWHHDSLSTGSAPVASFTASPTSGTAPLLVQFTDTSTGDPTSWAWDFGDGATSTERSPAHRYDSPGTYTVGLVATNAAGASAPATVTVTVEQALSASVTAGEGTSAGSTSALPGVTLTKPNGVGNGDLLIAQFTANNAPSVSSAPPGWSPVVSPLGVWSGARVFVYHHLVTDAAAEPASYTWQLSSAQTWNGGVAGFHGVDPVNPFDTPASTAVNTDYGVATLSVRGVSVGTAGAMLVGGVGVDSRSTGVTPPSGWSEAFEGTGAQVSELAHRAGLPVGDTGEAVWRLSSGAGSAGWLRALRPAG